MASVALDDIWDAPIVQSPPRTTSSANSALSSSPVSGANAGRLRSTLFLDSDDSEPESNKPPVTYASRPPAERPDIDALFDDLDDDPELAVRELAPSLDLDTLRREADAKNAGSLASDPLSLDNPTVASQPDGEALNQQGKDHGDENKKRKPVPRLDEARLLGPDGFPALVKQVKNFQPRGKGHELADLSSLLNVYQFWTHKMYPRTQFRDTVQRVERLCHSKRMHVALSMWRDEAKGLINGCRPEDQENDLASNTDDDSDNDQSAAHKKQDIDLDDRSPHHRAPLLPSSASEAASPDAWNDLNVDVAGVRDNGKQRTIGGSSSRGIDLTTDEDEAMWDELASGMDIEEMWDSPAASTTAVTSVPSNGVHVATTAGGDEDEDMWDLVRELEAEQASVVSPMHGSEAQLPAVDNLTTEGGSRPASNEAGWDDMYL